MKESGSSLEFNTIADQYDFLNHLLSFGQDYYWRYAMVKSLAPEAGELVLDLASGTGDSARPVLKKGAAVVGMDISRNMLMKAKQKITRADYNVVLGSAYELPVMSGTFDAITCAFGIRNMQETLSALREIHRVTKKGGRAVFLEFSMPRGFINPLYNLYLRRVLPFFAGLFSDRAAYDYLGDSIEKFHSPEGFARLIVEAGFSRCEMKRLSMGCVYIHKAYKD